MKQFIGEWGSLIVTSLLAIITAWYVVLTRTIAQASRESAESAREAAQGARLAAEASRASADAAIAGLQVDFEITPFYSFGFDERMEGKDEIGVQLRARGPAVFVHRLVLDFVGVPEIVNSGRVFTTAGIHDTELLPREPVPRRLHAGEALYFELPAGQPRPQNVGALSGRVEYSVDGSAPVATRHVDWRGRWGIDFEWPVRGVHAVADSLHRLGRFAARRLRRRS